LWVENCFFIDEYPEYSMQKPTRKMKAQSPSFVVQWRYVLVQLLVLLCFTTTVVMAADYYKILNLSRDATTKEIKKAYRALSLQYHPDKNKEEGAAEKFAEIARAYEVLADEDLRQIYDRHGEEGIKRHEGQGGGGGGAGGFEDIFSQFGFNFGGRRGRGEGERRTPSVEMPLFLSMNQLYLGTTIEVDYVRQVLCLQWEMCLSNAPDCQSAGIRIRRQQIAPGFVQQVQQRDPRCVAPGKMWRSNCKDCPEKTHAEKIALTVEVQPGLRNGEHITFEGVTDEQPGMTPGDLHFVIMEEPHDVYHRDRDDLYMTMEVELVDALTGFQIELSQLDGTPFTVTVDDVTDCDHVLRVAGKGMPRRNGRGFGDLYITFEVDFPDSLTEKQKKEIRKILSEDGGAGDEL
jgi:DnaJ-class molecular chaperone